MFIFTPFIVNVVVFMEFFGMLYHVIWDKYFSMSYFLWLSKWNPTGYQVFQLFYVFCCFNIFFTFTGIDFVAVMSLVIKVYFIFFMFRFLL